MSADICLNFFWRTILETLDKSTPGGIYLCQINETLSCGACCGLYNVADSSYDTLLDMLTYRTQLFERTPRDYDSLVEFQEIIQAKEGSERPFPEFHHCHYIGLIGDGKKRPGCLLHPYGDGNNNVDHRGLSHWGGFACASYFCPTCSQLPKRFKQILRICADNWYIYGLIITETGMLNNFFTIMEESHGKELRPESFKANEPLRKTLFEFFNLKSTWEFRPEGFNKLGNYFFKDNLYPRDPIDYEGLGVQESPFNEILLALGSEFNTSDALAEAESLISEKIARIVSLI